jgi:hypothetical protein
MGVRVFGWTVIPTTGETRLVGAFADSVMFDKARFHFRPDNYDIDFPHHTLYVITLHTVISIC